MDDAFGHWLAGFIDGEGCFRIAPHGQQFSCRFGLALREDDALILHEIVRQTGIGHVSRHGQQGNSAPMVKWDVASTSDALALVELLDRFPLRAKKLRDYELWREAVMYRAAQPRRGVDWKPVAELHDALKAARVFV